MSQVNVRIQCAPGLRTSAGCSPGQLRWWLRQTHKSGGAFVDIGEHLGDQPLDVTIELPVNGRYVLGTGTRATGTRHLLSVEPDPAQPAVRNARFRKNMSYRQDED